MPCPYKLGLKYFFATLPYRVALLSDAMRFEYTTSFVPVTYEQEERGIWIFKSKRPTVAHKTSRIEEVITERGVQILWLASYSPD